MELEREIPIWFNGKVKWISNLTSRSKCSDIIEAILSSENCLTGKDEDYMLYESWRGVERSLKDRCRLLKLWKSWEEESENVILTLRSSKEEKVPQYFLIVEQENKLKKLKNEIKRNDQKILKLNLLFKSNKILIDLNNSINNLNKQIKYQEKRIFNFKNEIKKDLNEILLNINQTLSYRRILNHLSNQLDQQIYFINQNIQKKQMILDQLELDWTLEDNIHIHNLNDQDQHLLSYSPSSSIIPIQILSVRNCPTTIIETNLSKLKEKESLLSPLKLNKQEKILRKSQIEFVPFQFQNKSFFSIDNNDESDTGISSIYSNDEQLITLV